MLWEKKWVPSIKMSFTISANIGLNRENTPAGVFYRGLKVCITISHCSGWSYIASQPCNHDCAALFMGTQNDLQSVYSIKTAHQSLWNIQTSAEHMCVAKNSLSSAMLALKPQDTKPALQSEPFIFDRLWTKNVARIDSTSDFYNNWEGAFWNNK